MADIKVRRFIIRILTQTPDVNRTSKEINRVCVNNLIEKAY